MRSLAVSIAAFVLSGLVAPTHAAGQQPTPKPKLTATLGSAFPDRSYILQLPPHSSMTGLSLTENGIPVSGLAVSASGGKASGAYVVSYRSLLGPQVRAVVSATIAGFPAATTTYTTPALDVAASQRFEWRWTDSQYVTIFVIVAVLALMALDLLTRFKLRD